MNVTSSPQNLPLFLCLAVHDSALNRSVPFEIVMSTSLNLELEVVNYCDHVSQIKLSPQMFLTVSNNYREDVCQYNSQSLF
jgi:hypothetical protein